MKNWGMNMTDDAKRDDRLENLFAAARSAPPEPSGALMARVMRAAQTEMRMRAAPVRDSVFARVLAVIGGWGGVGGLATAACAGLWIGFAGNVAPEGLAYGLADPSGASVELLPEAEVSAFLDGSEG